MALDTRNRRASALLDAVTFPNPDGTIVVGDRQHTTELYAFTSTSTAGGVPSLPDSSQTRWVIPFRTGSLVISASASGFVITTP